MCSRDLVLAAEASLSHLGSLECSFSICLDRAERVVPVGCSALGIFFCHKRKHAKLALGGKSLEELQAS